MAKYNIHYACGHAMEKQLFGKTENRRNYIEWAEKHGSCPNCKKDDALAEIDSLEHEHSLCTLIGSEKQIAWARKIRFEKINEILEYFEKMRTKIHDNDKIDVFDQNCSIVMNYLINEPVATYWINVRDMIGKNIATAAFKEVKN